ncbi:MAG: PilZ domain-containing protein [Deltaproteobacteria bacterium]|nr:MAG: PilZ domain-containing protein [Deltaproteobacteria bacterium]
MSNDRRREADRRQPDDVAAPVERRSGERRRRAGERRGMDRTRKRVPCEVQIDGSWQRTFVLDLSPGGLFVQTGKAVDPGTDVGIRLHIGSEAAPMELRATVARNRRVPANLAGVEAPGIGVRIRSAPNAYYDLLARLATEGSSALAAPRAESASKAPAKPMFEFRVRAKQTSGSRSRTIVVGADSPEAAEARALRELGSKWKVLSVERV